MKKELEKKTNEEIKEVEEKKEPVVDFASIGKEISSLKEENKKLNELLLQVADKKQLAIYYKRNKEKTLPVVRLRTIEGKVIVGWRTITDKVDQDPITFRWRERQTIEVLYEDGKSQQFALMDYVNLYRHIEANITSVVTDEETGKIAFKVTAINGKEYVIGAEFVN